MADEAIKLQDGFEDILGSGAIARKRISQGKGEREVEMGEEITIKFSGYLLESDTPFTTDEKVTFRIGGGEVIPALELGAKMMKVGEVCEVHCVGRFGYGEAGLESEGVPPNANLKFTIELLVIVSGALAESEMTVEQRIGESTKKKNHGNRFFKQKQYANASRLYDAAFKLVCQIESPADQPLPQKLMMELKVLLVSVMNNLSNSMIKQGNYMDAKRAANTVLSIDENNVKGLYRLALAMLEMDDTEFAIQVLMKGIKVHPNNPDLRSLLARVNERHKVVKSKEQKMYSNMMDALKEEEDSAMADTDDFDENIFKQPESKKKWTFTNYDAWMASIVILLLSICYRVAIRDY